MMFKNKFSSVSALTVVTLMVTLLACSDDFINRPPQDAIVDANFYKSDAQLLAASAPLYNSVWFQYNDKASHGIGDGRGGVLSSNYSYQLENIQFRTTAVTAENASSWKAFYNVIGQSNMLLLNINKYAGGEVTESGKNHVVAEARFMRGLAYMYLVQNYGAVPIITDNLAVLGDTSIYRNTIESVWEFVTRDIRYGTENLPETPIQKGRLTKWAAEGMLAKVYLTRAGIGASSATDRNQQFLDSAKYFAKDVIDNSGATLMADYEELFKMKNNNNSETLFALQWTYNGDWGTQNSVQAFLAFSSSITGTPDGWGGDLGASLFMLGKYEGLLENGVTNDTRRKATFMFPGDHYSYIHQQVLDDSGNPFTQELVVPTGGAGYNGRAWIKKYVVGRAEDNEGKVLQQRTEIQTYMLRLADVYLIYAESILGNNTSTTDADALEYYNRVRERAGLTAKGSINLDDIYNERFAEFAMEGQMWYDYVRKWYFDPEGVYAELSSQNRGFTRITPDDPDSPTKWTIIDDPDYTGPKTFNVNDGNFQLPLPESEVTKLPSLRKTPVEYQF